MDSHALGQFNQPNANVPINPDWLNPSTSTLPGGGLHRVESGLSLHSASVPTTPAASGSSHPISLGNSPATAFSPSYFQQLAQSYPNQAPTDWASQFGPRSFTNAPTTPSPFLPFGPSSMPNTPAIGFNPHLNQIPSTSSPFALAQSVPPSTDGSVLAMQLGLSSHLASGSNPAGGLSSGPASPVLPGSKAIDKLSRTAKAPPKRSSSFVKAARGAAAAGAQPGPSSLPRPLHIRGTSHNAVVNPSPLGSPLGSPKFGPSSPVNAYAVPAAASYQRPLPPLPRSRQNTAPIQSPAASTSNLSNPFGSYAQPSASLQSSALSGQPTPPLSRAQSPHVGSVDYDFSALEDDLDRFSSGGFASAAAAAMASVGPNRAKAHKNVAGFGVGGYGSPSASPFIEAGVSSPKVLTDVLSESVYDSLPARSPNGSTPVSPLDYSSLTNSQILGQQPITASGLSPRLAPPVEASPQGSASPSGSTIIDEESAEALSKKDPIAAQVWRMFNKAKNTLPNGARMENLTWRLMSMTLKKRREESAAAEQQAEADALQAFLSQAQAEVAEADAIAAEEADGLHELRRTATNASSKTAVVPEEEPERGRRRRTAGGADKSASQSPEASGPSEEDFMDWRAKSQSRSRSRAPDTMDWRAASRSRSRAPDFRVAVAPPAIDSTPATAAFSRFGSSSYGSGLSSMTSMQPPPMRSRHGTATGAEIEAALATGPSSTQESNAPGAGSSAFAFPTSPEAADGGADPNLAAIESTLNQLISLQSLAASPVAGVPQSPAIRSNLSLGATPSSSFVTSPNGAVTSPFSTGSPVVASPFGPSSPSILGGSGAGSLSSSLHEGSLLTSLHERASTADSHFSHLSLAQQQLQNLAQSRVGSHHSLSQSTTPHKGPVAGSSSSPYINATTLAQSSRPFSSASGISLGRPIGAHEGSQSVPPTPSIESSSLGHQSFLSHSAASTPGPSPWAHQQTVGSLPSSLYEDPTDSGQLLLDYFHSQDQASFGAAAFHATNGFSFDSSAAGGATHINPSQLISNLHSHTGGGYESETPSSWGVSPRSAIDSPRTGTPSPPDAKPGTTTHQRSLPQLNPNHHAVAPQAGPAPRAKKNHARANTVPASMPASIPEEDATVKKDGPPAPEGDAAASTGPRCLNCSTVNTPLWRRDAEGRPLCNACGLFKQLHGVDRPASLNTGVVKKRNRARGPKEGGAKPKASGARSQGGAAHARRNSTSGALGGAGGAGSPPPLSSSVSSGPGASRTPVGMAGARAGGAPYPSQALRQEQQKPGLG